MPKTLTIEALRDLAERSLHHRFLAEERVRPPNFRSLVAFLRARLGDGRVTVEPWAHTPYRRVGRLRRYTGARRTGFRLTVTKADGAVAFTHDTTASGTTNWHLVERIVGLDAELAPPAGPCPPAMPGSAAEA